MNDPNATKLYGFEGEAQAVFGDLSFDTSFGLMHSQLGTFYAADPRFVDSSRVRLVEPDTRPVPRAPHCVNLGGHAQTYAPNFTFNVGAQYNFNLDGGDMLTPRVNYGHVGPQWATLFENPALGDRLAQRNILNAQLAWTHGDYVVTLYGTNLTNDQYVGGPQLEPRLRRAAASVRHPHLEDVLIPRGPIGRRLLQSAGGRNFLYDVSHTRSCNLTLSPSTNSSITRPSGAVIARSSRRKRAASATLHSENAAIACRARSRLSGLKFGDRIATLAWNTQYHLEMYYGAMGAGFVCHTLNPRLTVAHLAAMVNEAEDRVLAVGVGLTDVAHELARALSVHRSHRASRRHAGRNAIRHRSPHLRVRSSARRAGPRDALGRFRRRIRRRGFATHRARRARRRACSTRTAPTIFTRCARCRPMRSR